MKRSWIADALLTGFLLLIIGCKRPPATSWQGYLEGEFIYVASPLAGRLDQLSVQKGARVEARAPLFTLERAAELAAQREAVGRLRTAQARLEDLKKGLRPSEIAALEARLAQARASAKLSSIELARIIKLRETSVVPETDEDRAKSSHESNLQLVAEIEADLATARLGARPDAIVAAEADVAAAQAAVERADWNVNQKTQSAARSALVYDTLYREGEFVSAGATVVALLPPENIKVRFFVTEAEFGNLKAGETLNLTVTGSSSPVPVRVTYLSPRPEYTPPVLYNRENRAKIVFMVEAIPIDPAAARDLHPGQPADVSR